MRCKNKEIISFALCVLLMLSIIFALVFVELHLNHNCTGENCFICQLLCQAKKLYGAFISVLGVGLYLYLLHIDLFAKKPLFVRLSTVSPTSLKIKLQN